MIKIRIAEIAEKRGIMNAYQLQKGLNCSPTMASRLWKGNFKQIGISTLSGLCALLDCETSDLLFAGTKTEKTAKPPAIVKQSATGSDLLTTIEVAERLGLSRKRVNDYVNSGELRSIKGKQNHNFISESDLQEFIDARKG